MEGGNRIIDWRLTWILLSFGVFNLPQVIPGVAGELDLFLFIDFYDWSRLASIRWFACVGSLGTLVVLLAIWIAMAGSARPWRLMIASLAGLHLIFLAIVRSIYWVDYSNDSMDIAGGLVGLFFLTLLATFVLVVMRLWGWSIEDARCRRPGIAPAVGAPGARDVPVQFSLTSLLLWMVGFGVLLSVLSTLVTSTAPLVASVPYEGLVIVLIGPGMGVVAITPLLLRVALGETCRTRGAVILGTVLVSLTLVCVAVAPIATQGRDLLLYVLMQTAIITVASSIWTLPQLLILRATGYRFLRIPRVETIAAPCDAATPRGE